MKDLYKNILNSIDQGEHLLAVLIDPEKREIDHLSEFMNKLTNSIATHIFVGGSTVHAEKTEALILELKKHTTVPIFLFPGDVIQITEEADALLFLSLISGDNPDYLIKKQVESISQLRNSNLEVIPTGYVLIENGKETSVQRVTNTRPLSRNDVQFIADTAKAGELLGMKLMYLEAGSGALHPISEDIIKAVKSDLNIPLIVGGGIRSVQQMKNAYNSGADMVVIGTAFEENEDFFKELKIEPRTERRE